MIIQIFYLHTPPPPLVVERAPSLFGHRGGVKVILFSIAGILKCMTLLPEEPEDPSAPLEGLI